ncbi:hypothetical protein BJF78_15730 [Pseudonocardia sp. CNS-139]|nr:hypothetical protein BJF78_15730 [Pseudonocardia sp. CNS-139]
MIGAVPTGLNVALQLAALAVAVIVRLASPGWMLVIAVVSVVPLAVAALPSVLALGTLRRHRLTAPVAVPFTVSAAALVLVALLYPELDDVTSWVPVLRLAGLQDDIDRGADIITASSVGNAAVLLLVTATVWTVVAVVVTRRRTRERAA